MEQKKRYKKISRYTVLFSSLFIAINTLKGLFWYYTRFDIGLEEIIKDLDYPVLFVYSHYLKIVLFLILIGCTIFIGGIYLMRNINDASRMIIIFSSIMIFFYG